ncbi:heavy-metal-associated domain-containing protein [Paracoccaceae bacterium]
MIEMTLPNMTCGGCARGVTAAIKGVDPTAEIAIDVATRKVRVTTKVTAAKIIEVLGTAGFPPA